MSDRINLARTFRQYAERFEAATTRAETDTVMRAFLSTIHSIAGTDHWDLETSPEAMGEMTRIIDAWKRYRENPIENQVREIVKVAACKRWTLEPWQWNTTIVVKRVEQNGPDAWIGYYDEPDTRTEEAMDVKRVGDKLHASHTEDILVEWKIEQQEGN